MPGLVLTQSALDEENTTPLTPREKILSRSTAYSASNRRFMWTSVGVIILAIVGLWGYALASQFSFIDWSKSSEARLIANTRRDWETLFDEKASIKDTVQVGINTLVGKIKSEEAVLPIITTATTSTATTTSL
jgi:hypothetical protein